MQSTRDTCGDDIISRWFDSFEHPWEYWLCIVGMFMNVLFLIDGLQYSCGIRIPFICDLLDKSHGPITVEQYRAWIHSEEHRRHWIEFYKRSERRRKENEQEIIETLTTYYKWIIFLIKPFYYLFYYLIKYTNVFYIICAIPSIYEYLNTIVKSLTSKTSKISETTSTTAIATTQAIKKFQQ